MYSFKEKKRHFSDLKNTSAAESDLLLLKSKVKQVISAWERQPKRYADDILFRLLDVATREEIRINRRERMKVQEESSTGDETKDPVDNSVSREGSENVFRKLKLPERKPRNVPRKQKQPWKKPRNVLRKQRRLLKKRKKKSRIQRAPHEKSEKAKARRVPANRLG